MLVELSLGAFVWQTIEVVEEAHLLGDLGPFLLPGPLGQVVNEHLWVDFFLDEQRRRTDHQVRPILFVLTAPDKLGIEVAVTAFIRHADGVLVLLA
jgi:hypothetical protein